MTRKISTCTACKQQGHTKASKDCPLYVPFWNNETEQKLIVLIGDTDEIDWEDISSKMGVAITNCKNKYNELCPIDTKLKIKLNKLTDEFIEKLLEDNKKICEVCGKYQYNSLNIWKGIKECDECYYQHNNEIKLLWIEIRKYCIENQMAHCLFCNKEKKNKTVFNFDHINMFDKDNSIITMIYTGEPIELIINEVKKCQVLCKSCHCIVTKIENTLGFIPIKKITYKTFEGEELESKIKEYGELYTTHMHTVYKKIQESFKSI